MGPSRCAGPTFRRILCKRRTTGAADAFFQHIRCPIYCLLILFPQHMIRLADLNPYILCSLCQGYFIDATTITECLHTFCKSCIVQHFYYNNRCPKCNVIVHQTQPLYNIRLDRQLQDLVFKLVVNLEDREKNQMYDFYRERGLEVPKPVVPHSVSTGRGRQKKPFGPLFQIPPELDVSLLLEFIG
ncbi:unnamed protein product [Ranitomeya imitator]|uniref:RING-type domain-containing protein n=1 Tax=Ranitomeya imitator TaxID=111125 RepID=A0ABN9M7M0_9NEOB|nr:unnamed protein product [Ranitomeya imitator]